MQKPVHAIRANRYHCPCITLEVSYVSVSKSSITLRYFNKSMFRRTLQNYTKIFNSCTYDRKNRKKCDGFVHYLAFGIRFRLRILVNGAVGGGRPRNTASTEVYMPHIELRARLRDGLITPMRGLLGTAHSCFSEKSEKLSAICETADCRFLCTFAVEKVQ